MGRDFGLFGEYGSNNDRSPVPLWMTRDDGRSWHIEKYLNSIRHVHGVYGDPFSSSVWLTTGDKDGECHLIEFRNGETGKFIFHGNGTQLCRPVGLYFSKTFLSWGMDSEISKCQIVTLDRVTGELGRHSFLPGPCWYIKKFLDNSCVFQTSVEVGIGSTSNHSHIFFSQDGVTLYDVAKFKKDFWPKKLFKFGVIGFASGDQTKSDFVIFGEALKGIDGSIYRCRIS